MALSVQEQMLIEQRVANDAKSTGVAYLLWIFLGLISAHRFYLGRPGSALLQILTYFVGVGFIWWIADAFLIPGMIKEHQNEIRRDMRRQMDVSRDDLPPVDTSRWSEADRMAHEAGRRS